MTAWPANLNHSETCSWRFGIDAACDCRLSEQPDTTDQRVRQILLDGAREAYAPQTTEREGIPVDRRCSGCGVDRPFCDQAFCARKHDDEED